MLGVALGLTVAFFLGLTDILATLAARRLGAMKAVFQAQVYGVLALLCFEGFAIWYWHISLNSMALFSSVVIGIFTGMCGAVGNFSFYRALAIGPVALVGPLLATSSAVTVLLSFLFIHERLQPVAAICVSAIILGVTLASIEKLTLFRQPCPVLFSRGLAWAILATVAFGAMDFGMGAAVAVSNWFLPLLWTRLFGLCFLTLLWWGRQAGVVPRTETMMAVSASPQESVFQRKNAAPSSAPHPAILTPVHSAPYEVTHPSLLPLSSSATCTSPPLEDDDATLPRIPKVALASATESLAASIDMQVHEEQGMNLLRAVTLPQMRAVRVKKLSSRSALLIVILAGILENIAILFFSFDTRIATTGVTAAIASSYVLMVTIFGVVVYREHLAKHQWSGVILFLLGTAMLALYR